MDHLAEYLNENEIEYKYDHNNYICINKFKCFVKPYISIYQPINDILNGNDEAANKLIKNLEDIDYTMHIYLNEDKYDYCFIMTQFTKFTLYYNDDDGVQVDDDINFELCGKSTKFIQNNLIYAINNLNIDIGEYLININPRNVLFLHKTNMVYIKMYNYEDFIKFIQENMAEYIINHDIKIALKD